MSDQIDINIETDEQLNQQLVDSLLHSDFGHQKEASAAGSTMIRRELREGGFGRLVLPHEPVNDDDLQMLPDTEEPVIVEEMEPASAGAKSIPFNDTPDTKFYYGDKFVVYFCKITTPEFTKNKNELRTYRHDLRKVVTDNSLKDIQTEEDNRFIAEVDRVCGSFAGVSPVTGVKQHHEVTDGLAARDNYKDLLSHIEDRKLNNGAFLMNRKSGKQFLGWNRSEIGGDLAERLLRKGLSALEQAELYGIRHIFTMKNDLVLDNVVYQFAEPGFLGRAYILEDVTLWVEKKRDILRFSADEIIGICFANAKAMNKTTCTPS